MPSRRTLVAATSLALLTGGLGLGTAHAATDTVYVDVRSASCNDSGPGTQAEPYCQVQAAADAAQPGETVYVDPGTYAPVTITAKGTAAAPITFFASPAARAYVTTSSGSAITFSGAQYVSLTGFSAHSAGASSVAVEGSQHISYDMGVVTVQAVPGATGTPAPEVAVDGASASVSLTRTMVSGALGWAVGTTSGAQDVTLASDVIINAHVGAVQAVGTSALHLAGDTLTSDCGDGVSLTGGSSGSVENTVATIVAGAACTGDSSPAEISADASSAPRVTADYNAVNPVSTGTDYDWSGTGYATAQAFQAATGQGSHDLDQTTTALSGLAISRLSEGSHLIDSANADAPGELNTDWRGLPRVDDPLVTPDSGAGAETYYDRGAVEFQDPLQVTGMGVSPSPVYATEPATLTANVSNPWSDTLHYAFDLGDNTSADSATNSVGHTYGQNLGGTTVYPSVTVTTAAGTKVGSWSIPVAVDAIPALSSSFGCSGGFSPSAPDTTRCDYGVNSHYPLTTGQIDFGDGTAPVPLDATGGSITHVYAAPGHYTATEKLADDHGRTFTSTSSVTVGPAYVPTGAIRLVNAAGTPLQAVGPGGVIRLKIEGTGKIPTSGVSAVVLNLTDTGATAASFVTAYPEGTKPPATSNLNFKAGQTNANLVTVPVGNDGYVDLYNHSGRVDLIADVEGYYTTTPAQSGIMSYLTPITPTPVVDTRYGLGALRAKVNPNSMLVFTLPQAEDGATVGALLNVTATGGTADSFLTVYCAGTLPPASSNLNFRGGQTVSNLVQVPVCENGEVAIYNHSGRVDVKADLQGLFKDDLAYSGTSPLPQGGPMVTTAPARILDTIDGIGTGKARLGAGSTLTLKVAGVGQVPADARAVLVNLTGVGPTAGTYLTAYGDGTRPSTSNLNIDAGDTRPVLALVPVDANGCIHLYNHTGSIDVLADLAGYVGG